jgi:hypothetical protein
MADTTTVQNTPDKPVPAADEETQRRTWLKEKYGIEDDPDTFKTRRATWSKAEEEIPQYQATLTALIQHVRDLEGSKVAAPVQTAPADDEERLRTISKLDPYEGMKRYFSNFEKKIDEKISGVQAYSQKSSEAAVVRRESMRRSYDIVKENWPEALDTATELHKTGRQIYQQEMSDWEKNHPQAFLIATERAAGRLGLAPSPKRRKVDRSASAAAQSVSRDRVKPPSDDDDEPLSNRQKQVSEAMGVSPKVYKEALKNRKAQAKKQDDE